MLFFDKINYAPVSDIFRRKYALDITHKIFIVSK